MKDKLRLDRARIRTAGRAYAARLGGREPALHEAPDDDDEDDGDPDEIGGRLHPFRPGRLRRPLRDGGVDLDPSVDDEYEEEGYEKAGDDARQKELAYRLLRDYAVDNE